MKNTVPPLNIEKGATSPALPRPKPSRPACAHAPELCCVKCAPWWTAEIAALPRKTDTVFLRDAHHAHTSSMRLRNVADRLVKDPALLQELCMPLLRDQVVGQLREVADEIDRGSAEE